MTIVGGSRASTRKGSLGYALGWACVAFLFLRWTYLTGADSWLRLSWQPTHSTAESLVEAGRERTGSFVVITFTGSFKTEAELAGMRSLSRPVYASTLIVNGVTLLVTSASQKPTSPIRGIVSTPQPDTSLSLCAERAAASSPTRSLVYVDAIPADPWLLGASFFSAVCFAFAAIRCTGHVRSMSAMTHRMSDTNYDLE